MTYLGELKHLQLNQFEGSKLLTFNENRKLLKDSTKRRGKSELGWSDFCIAYFKLYCDQAAVHGVRYLTDSRLYKFEKIIWGIIMLAATIACAYVYKLLSDRYQSPGIHTIIEDSVLPVFFVPFPAIAICTRYRFNWSKMPAAEARFLPLNPSQDSLNAFREFFQRFEEFQFGRFEYFENLEALQLELINDISIIDVMRFLTYTCEDLFGTTNGTCLWRKRVYNCCELFKLERTEVGFCQVFNSIILPTMQERDKRDPFYPYRNSKSGEKSGLQVTVRLNNSQKRPEANVPNGIYLMVKKNHQWNIDWKFISSDTYTRVGITPQLTDSRPEVRRVPPDERKCLFDDEVGHRLYKKISGLNYLRANCRVQCHHEYVLKTCNCSMPLLFPELDNTSFSPCTPKDFICLYRYRNIFNYEKHPLEDEFIGTANEQMMCTCMNSCELLVFTSSVSSVFLRSNYSELEYINLDVYYNLDYMMKYVSVLSYTYVELIGNFGGIIGLFLGASLLSGAELIYYATIGLGAFVRKDAHKDPNLKLMHFKVQKVHPKVEEKPQYARKSMRQRF